MAPGETSWVVTCQFDLRIMDFPSTVSAASTFRPRPFSSSVASSSVLPTTFGTVTPDTTSAVADADDVAAVCADLLPHPVNKRPANMASASTFFKISPCRAMPGDCHRGQDIGKGRQCLRLPTGSLEHKVPALALPSGQVEAWNSNMKPSPAAVGKLGEHLPWIKVACGIASRCVHEPACTPCKTGTRCELTSRGANARSPQRRPREGDAVLHATT
ncbi:hypothetical protein ABIB51_001369 [Arthrobacter sp. UYCu712]